MIHIGVRLAKLAFFLGIGLYHEGRFDSQRQKIFSSQWQCMTKNLKMQVLQA
jgi:hypothetical protein